MDDFNLGQLFSALGYLALVACPLALVFLIAKRQLTRSRLTRFFGILLIGSAASMIPMGLFGLLLGFPSVFIASVLTSAFLDNETIKALDEVKR